MNLKKIFKIVLIIVFCIIILIFMSKDKDNKLVNYKEAKRLYENHVSLKCSEVIKIESEEDIKNPKVLLYIIFSKLDKEKKLTSLTVEDYKEIGSEVINGDLPTEFEFIYNGYKYVLSNDTLTKKKASCEKNYVTKLYGYSGTEEDLRLDVMTGYIKGNNVYDLNDKKIGVYDKETLNKTLDSGSRQVFKFKKYGDNYKLIGVQ